METLSLFTPFLVYRFWTFSDFFNFRFRYKKTIFHKIESKSAFHTVVVAHIYPPVTGQRQKLTYGTIRTLFITKTTSWLEESTPA